MLFRRRDSEKFITRVRVYLWPRRNWSRSLRYLFKRIIRLSSSPHSVACGVGAGIFASMTPFVGFHILFSALICLAIGGNMLAAVLATIVGNPLTFPFIWLTIYELGKFILGENAVNGVDPKLLMDLHWAELRVLGWNNFWPVFKAMIIGSIPLGLVTGGIGYIVTKKAVRAYQRRRNQATLERIKRKDI